MLIPLEQARWPAPGEVRDLRVSLNAPVLLGPDPGAGPTRAALGWLPRPEARAVVRLWLRAEPGPGGPAGSAEVRAFDLAEQPAGPAARASLLEGAERFLCGLGFLLADPLRDACDAPLGAADADEPTAPGDAPVAELRTSVLDPVDADGATAAAVDVRAAVRADVRLTRFRRRGAERPPGGSENDRSRSRIDGLLLSVGLRKEGNPT